VFTLDFCDIFRTINFEYISEIPRPSSILNRSCLSFCCPCPTINKSCQPESSSPLAARRLPSRWFAYWPSRGWKIKAEQSQKCRNLYGNNFEEFVKPEDGDAGQSHARPCIVFLPFRLGFVSFRLGLCLGLGFGVWGLPGSVPYARVH